MSSKLPASVLEASGAFDKNPGRRRVDPIATGELGDAPNYFTADQVEVWKEIKAQLLPGLCKSADRIMLEIAVRLTHKFRSIGLASSELAQLINSLGRLGLSPADRSKCSVPVDKKPQASEFTEFV